MSLSAGGGWYALRSLQSKYDILIYYTGEQTLWETQWRVNENIRWEVAIRAKGHSTRQNSSGGRGGWTSMNDWTHMQ